MAHLVHSTTRYVVQRMANRSVVQAAVRKFSSSRRKDVASIAVIGAGWWRSWYTIYITLHAITLYSISRSCYTILSKLRNIDWVDTIRCDTSLLRGKQTDMYLCIHTKVKAGIYPNCTSTQTLRWPLLSIPPKKFAQRSTRTSSNCRSCRQNTRYVQSLIPWRTTVTWLSASAAASAL